jgi:exosome complex component RRP42
MDISVNSSIVNFISSLVNENRRFDGREYLEYRKIKVIDNYIKNAEGSAFVSLGNTKVLAGVKLGIEEPFKDTPDEGFFVVTLEHFPGSHYNKEPGPPMPEEIECARLVDRTLRGSDFIDTKKLVIEEGKYVWAIYIDIYIVNNDGNIVDASTLAAVKALENARFPKIEKVGDTYRIDPKIKTEEKLPLNLRKKPVSITFAKVSNKILLDPILYEEEAATDIISIGLTDEIHNIQFLKSSGITMEEVFDLIDIAKKERRKLLRIL